MVGSANMNVFGSRLRLSAALLLPATLLGGCVVWKSDYDALQAQNRQLQQQLTSTTNELNTTKVQAGRLGGAILFTVNSDLAFAPGSWELTSRGKSLIGSFAKKLGPTQQQKLMVTGYTDTTPIGPELATQGVTSNQILSEKRAQAVMEYMISQGIRPDMVTARGMGDQNPTASNTTPAGRAKNRRVDISAM
jgi:chemotaxis protein MotB